MAKYRRLPRRLKKTITKRGFKYQDFLENFHMRFHRMKHLDSLFNKDYTNSAIEIFQKQFHGNR